MKKNILTKISLILGSFLFALPLMAGTIGTFSPSNANVNVGQKFNVSIGVNPQGTANYVEKLELNYPADLLQVDSFTFESNWIPMTQDGYSLTDNVNGVLIRTAGYPKGITTSTTFGTVSFTAKKAGSGVIKFGGGSLAFEVKAQTAITGNTVAFTVATPVVQTTPTPTPTQQVTTTPNTAQTTTPTPATPTATTSTTTEDLSSQTAAVSGGESSGKLWWWIIGLVALIAIISYGIYTSTKKQ